MSTLAEIRARLNYEIALDSSLDASDTVYPQAQRNQAIADGYDALWFEGVWKPLTQDLASVTDQWTYALTEIRRLRDIELYDSDNNLVDTPKGMVRDDGSGGYELRLTTPIASGYTIHVIGFGKYVSTFANDAATDDLPTEYQRVPLLYAKAVLFRAQAAKFARYATKQAGPPDMSVSLDGLLSMVAAAEREFADRVKAIKGDRPRVSQIRGLSGT